MNNKVRTIIIGVIISAIASLVFLLLPITPNLIIAFVFFLIGIIVMVLLTIFITRDNVKLPHDIPFFTFAWSYLIINMVVSVLGVSLQTFLPPQFFLLIHVAIFAGIVIWIIILSAGKSHIDRIDEKIKLKIFDIRAMLADLDALKEKANDLPSPVKEQTQKELKTIYDAVHYSDPMSHPSLKEYDDSIKESIILIDRAVDSKNVGEILNLSTKIQRQIKDRNNRVKLLK